MARILKSEADSWDEAVAYVKKCDTTWLEYWEDYHRWCKAIFRLYLAKNEWTTLNKRARLALSLPFTIVETVAAETYKALFDEIPYWKQKPVGPEDEEAADIVSKYVGHQTEKNKLRIKGYIFEKNRLMFGLSWAFIPWTFLKEWKRREVQAEEPETDESGSPIINPFTGKPQMKPLIDLFGNPVTRKEFKKEVSFDCWEFEPLLPWNVRSDPSIVDPNKLQNTGIGVIVDRFYSKQDLKSRYRDGIYKNVDKYFDDEESDDVERSVATASDEDEEMARDLNAGYSYKRNLHHVRQFWGKAPIVSQQRKSGEVIIWDSSAEPVEALIDICGNQCLRLKRNPLDEQLRPVIATQCHPVADSLISPGLLQAVESEIKEYNAFRNARMDNLAQQMNPMYNVRAGVNVPVRDLRWRANGIIRTPNPESDIIPVPTPSLGQTLSQDLAGLDYSIQNATNALSAAQGTSNMGQAFGRTAAGINFFQSRMQSRIQVIVEVSEDQFFGRLSDIVNSYNTQFLTKPEDFAVIGSKNVYVTIRPDYLSRRDLVPVSASRKINRAKMLPLYDRLITEASSLKDFIKVDYLIQEMIKTTDLFPNPEKVLYSEEERQKMQASQPDQIKKGMNLTVSWNDLEPEIKKVLLGDIFPQIKDDLEQLEMLPSNQELKAQQQFSDQQMKALEMQNQMPPMTSYG